jgi:hypothetical protein
MLDRRKGISVDLGQARPQHFLIASEIAVAQPHRRYRVDPEENGRHRDETIETRLALSAPAKSGCVRGKLVRMALVAGVTKSQTGG